MASKKIINRTFLATYEENRSRIDAGTCTPADVLAWFEWTVANAAGLSADLGTYSVKDLKEMLRFCHGTTKDSLVKQIYNDLVHWFALGSFSWTHGQDVTEVIRTKVRGLTAEAIAAHAKEVADAKAERAERIAAIKAALADPKTWEDFETVKRFSKEGIAGLPDAKRELYEQLGWQRDRAQREAAAAQESIIDAVELDDVQMALHQTIHTQKKHTLWVVTLSDWVERQDFEALCDAAHRLSGYYSSYSADGAIPGFTFKDEACARDFMKILEGDVDNQARREERRLLAKLGAAERMTYLADRITADADEEINRERKENTCRRADMAESIRKRARRAKAVAGSLRNIAVVVASGERHPLDGIRHRTHVELLEQAWQSIAAAIEKGETSAWWSVVLPPLRIHKEQVRSVHAALAACEHTVNVRKHLVKAYQEIAGSETNHIEFANEREREYAAKIFQRLGDGTPWYLAYALRERRKLNRMGIHTSRDLRVALRAYAALRVDPEQESEQHKLVRSLIGADIPGFFPTPETLVDAMLSYADIEDGMTVIEPSAGKGDIASAIIDRHPGAKLHCYEIHPSLANILRLSFEVTCDDWLAQKDVQADRIIMNPPFERGQDITHVQHAYDRLTAGGRVVAIISQGSLSRQDAASTAFQEWLRERQALVEPTPEGSFRQAFRSTNVATALVVIDKPAEAGTARATEAA